MIIGNSDDWYTHLERIDESEEYRREWEEYVAIERFLNEDY